MTISRPLALVTGASSGIGTELALELSRAGYELLLTGRDAGRLEEVAARVRAANSAAETLALDLADPGAVTALTRWVGARPLAVLVNNAGFGDSGPLAEADPKVLQSMIDLNVTALTQITRAFLPPMVSRGSGSILNVASTAAFSPIPSMAVYGATKAYVLSFSEALAEEVAGSGVLVTALCPGATLTRFADRAQMNSARLFRRTMTAEQVARIGIQALNQKNRVRIPGMTNALLTFFTRFAPRRVVTKIAANLMKKD